MAQGEGTVAEVLAGTARFAVVCGDATAVLASLPDGCAHVAYSDPPYGLSAQSTGDVVECLRAWLAGEVYTHSKAGFMSATWDAFVPGPEAWREVFRALKPGGHCVAFSSTRTVDLLGVAVRLAGFEMRPGWAWITGQAFPKSLDVSRAIDAAAGAEREVVGVHPSPAGNGAQASAALGGGWSEGVVHITAPATPAATQWDGYGTDLKPSYEPLVVARRPLDGTVAANVQRHGCGALNIDAGRITHATVNGGNLADNPHLRDSHKHGAKAAGEFLGGFREVTDTPVSRLGRFPASLALVHSEGCELVGTTRVAPNGQRRFRTEFNHRGDAMGYGFGSASSFATDTNPGVDADGMETCDEWVCVDGCAVAELARQSGERQGMVSARLLRGSTTGAGVGYNSTAKMQDAGVVGYDDHGTAARFFFNAKASSATRLAYITCAPGCAHHETVAGVREARATARDATKEHPHGWCVACGVARHHHLHSTVKPQDLARYHARLLSLPEHVAPLALVPYCGSGPEARALLEVGFRVIAVDLDPRHCAMTRHRLAQPLDAPQAKPARKAPRPAAAAPVAPAAPPPMAEAPPLVAVPSRPRGRAENAAQLSLFGTRGPQ